MHDEIDVAPVDAEIERRGGDDGAQLVAAHRRLHLPALLRLQRAVMQRDGQRILVDRPQFAEQKLGLRARVDEQKRRAVLADQFVDVRDGVARRMAGPRQATLGLQDGDGRLRAALHLHQIGHGSVVQRLAHVLRHQPAAKRVRIRHGGGQAHRLHVRREPAQPGEIEGQQVAALRRHQRVQLVQHHVAQVAKEPLRVLGRLQQRHLLGRRQQDVGRVRHLALALVRRRVAGAGLQRHLQAHLRDGALEVAQDVDRKRLERRDVEGVDAPVGFTRSGRFAIAQLHQRRQKSRQRLAGAGRRDQQRRATGLCAAEQFELMRAGRPAVAREPLHERGGQSRWRRIARCCNPRLD